VDFAYRADGHATDRILDEIDYFLAGERTTGDPNAAHRRSP